ncbi:protein lin-10-like isoform X2 [Paramacrobiotus metropolitanus]|uniref:protein lin-10-like isoform X2 n=1 Tax=Paramacrobiotus metropolitanus TaxID=2943436 RepID=UPI0024462A97|nr:protein lin-10-like isoform X2 [Paramacrobiotus metropolitanus]
MLFTIRTDDSSTDSSRVAQRLATVSSPVAERKTGRRSSASASTAASAVVVPCDSLISFKSDDAPEEASVAVSGNASAEDAVWSGRDEPLMDGPNGASPHANHINGLHLANDARINSRAPRTSLETIRQQIRQIESEIVSHRGYGASTPGDKEHLFGVPARPLQSSCSSQSIPATFHSQRHHDPDGRFGGRGNGVYAADGRWSVGGPMQRAYSVDVAVAAVLSDIQSAVRRNSMVRLKGSTYSLNEQRPPSVLGRGIQEEEDVVVSGPEDPEVNGDPVWVKRDSSAQTDTPHHNHHHPTMPSSPPLPSTDRTPLEPALEMEEEGDEESMYLLNSDPDLDKTPPSRLLAPRRPSAPLAAHELIEGVLFRCAYLGSTHLFSDTRPTKASRLTQAQEAVTRIKAPEGESQPMTEVELFISIEKIMVLNVDVRDVLMDHPLRTISYIADIGDLVVLMVKRGLEDLHCDAVIRSTQPKMLCHVFQSDEASVIAQTIGNAFQVAYMEYLKANGIQDERYLRHLDYLEVLNSQEMSTHELELFASKDKQNNVVIPKSKGEILGMVIVESGWGSMLPTVIIANMCPTGPAARCGKLSIGDQLISIDGISLVGLPLAHCQNAIKNVKNHTVVKLTVVACPPVVEVKIKRPDTRYQLGFSVQNGIICSLLRGGIAERGGIRVGHRIIEINNQSVVATNHDMIVNMLAHSVGEIQLKTMPSSIFRLLTGQDIPVYI